jgi:hypothetical protein
LEILHCPAKKAPCVYLGIGQLKRNREKVVGREALSNQTEL